MNNSHTISNRVSAERTLSAMTYWLSRCFQSPCNSASQPIANPKPPPILRVKVPMYICTPALTSNCSIPVRAVVDPASC